MPLLPLLPLPPLPPLSCLLDVGSKLPPLANSSTVLHADCAREFKLCYDVILL